MINRRAILKAGAAMATTGYTPNGFQAVSFDGKTYLTNPGTDPSLTLPASATKGTIVVSRRSTIPPKPFTYGLICGILGTGNGNLWLMITTFDKPKQQYLQLTITDPTGNSLGLSAWAPISCNPWYTDIIGFDTTIPSMTVVSNRPELPTTYNSGCTTKGQVLFGATIYIGGEGGRTGPHGVGWYKGDLADHWASFGQTIDPTDPNVIAGFYDTKNQVAVRNSPDGQNAIPGARPNWFLSGDYGSFLKNGPSSIGHYSWTDDDPQSPFTLAAGQLEPSDSDPFFPAPNSTSILSFIRRE